jgi:hypothetical protein
LITPGDLYEGQPDGTFLPTGLLTDVPSDAVAATATWFDANDDGSRDILNGYADALSGAWTIGLRENVRTSNHWLEVDLIGTPSNVPAIGASVAVTVGTHVVTQWVGMNDGSSYSQGHYRLYFGLGDATVVDALTIRWPDGTEQDMQPGVDALLRIAHPAHGGDTHPVPGERGH